MSSKLHKTRPLSLPSALTAVFHPSAQAAITAGTNPIKAWRLQRNCTVSELARCTRIKPDDIRVIEKDIHEALPSEYKAIAEELEIHPADFVPAHGPMPASLCAWLVGAVEGDPELRTLSAIRAVEALHLEAQKAAEALANAIRAQTRDDQKAIHALLVQLRDRDMLGPLSPSEVEQLYETVITQADRQIESTEDERRRLKRIMDQQDAQLDRVGAYLVPRDAQDKTIHKLHAAGAEYGMKALLGVLRARPEIFGFVPKPAQAPLFFEGRVYDWRQSLDLFIDVSSQYLACEVSFKQYEAESKALEAQKSVLSAWMDGEEGQAVINYVCNRTHIAKVLPNLMAPVPRPAYHSPTFRKWFEFRPGNAKP